jgi:uncharacterized protein (DUF1778 family)
VAGLPEVDVGSLKVFRHIFTQQIQLLVFIQVLFNWCLYSIQEIAIQIFARYGYCTYFCKNAIVMATTSIPEEKARFDTRLTKEQKQFFERAARLGGFRNLTDFVISAVQEKAKIIIKERELVLASQKDSETFFNAITNPESPNENLISAANDYETSISK